MHGGPYIHEQIGQFFQRKIVCEASLSYCCTDLFFFSNLENINKTTTKVWETIKHYPDKIETNILRLWRKQIVSIFLIMVWFCRLLSMSYGRVEHERSSKSEYNLLIVQSSQFAILSFLSRLKKRKTDGKHKDDKVQKGV